MVEEGTDEHDTKVDVMKRCISHTVECYTYITFSVVNLNTMDGGGMVLVREKGSSAGLFGVNLISLRA